MVEALAGHQEQEAAAAVHDHQVAGSYHADADRLGHGVRPAHGDGGPGVEARLAGGGSGDPAQDLGGGADGWQLFGRRNALGKSIGPAHGPEVDERTAMRRGVAVDRDHARQPKRKV